MKIRGKTLALVALLMLFSAWCGHAITEMNHTWQAEKAYKEAIFGDRN